MAVTLRLTRVGGKKTPFYRVVAADRRSPRDGRFLEQVGVYDPRRTPPEIRLDHERIEHWMAAGAVPSDTVKGLLRSVQRTARAAKTASASAGAATSD